MGSALPCVLVEILSDCWLWQLLPLIFRVSLLGHTPFIIGFAWSHDSNLSIGCYTSWNSKYFYAKLHLIDDADMHSCFLLSISFYNVCEWHLFTWNIELAAIPLCGDLAWPTCPSTVAPSLQPTDVSFLVYLCSSTAFNAVSVPCTAGMASIIAWPLLLFPGRARRFCSVVLGIWFYQVSAHVMQMWTRLIPIFWWYSWRCLGMPADHVQNDSPMKPDCVTAKRKRGGTPRLITSRRGQTETNLRRSH